uniref:DDE_Tnp_ISL3 domain-containing protein n=1 Tax=Ascaris lumbricoides TaxID=6252 RepID=A0A0M3HPX0_ASCLU
MKSGNRSSASMIGKTQPEKTQPNENSVEQLSAIPFHSARGRRLINIFLSKNLHRETAHLPSFRISAPRGEVLTKVDAYWSACKARCKMAQMPGPYNFTGWLEFDKIALGVM